MAVIRYQARDPENPQALIEGGLVQFSASLSVPAEALPQLEAAIRAKLGDDDTTIRLGALPFKVEVDWDQTYKLYSKVRPSPCCAASPSRSRSRGTTWLVHRGDEEVTVGYLADGDGFHPLLLAYDEERGGLLYVEIEVEVDADRLPAL